MPLPLRAKFFISAFSLSLTGAMTAAPALAETAKKIGMIKLSEPLPFTPQDLIEPFGWRLKLTENKEKGEVVVRSLIGSHIFTFYRDADDHIRRIYSPLYKNDSDLCQSFGVLEKEKPSIHKFLDKNFQASEHCKTPEVYP